MRSTAVLILACFFLPQLVAQSGGETKPEKLEVPAKESITAQVDRLVGELGNKDFRTRENADKALRALGRKAVPALKRHVDHKDLETRTRVRALIESAQEDIKPLTRSDGPVPQEDAEPRRRRLRGTRPDSFDDFRKRMDAMFDQGGNSSQRRMNFSSATSLSWEGEQLTLAQGSSGVRFTARPQRGAGKTQSWEARDMAEFKKKHADVYERYKGSGIFENAPLEFNILLPGQKRDNNQDPRLDPSRALEERMRRLFGSSTDPWSGGRLDFGTNDEFMKDLEERFRDFFEKTDRNGLFRDLDRARRSDRSLRPLRTPKKRLLGVEVSLPPAGVALDLARTDKDLTGLYVASTTRASLADTLGVKVGDVIVSLNGKPTAEIRELRSAFQATKPGESIQLQIWRRGELKTLKGKIPGEAKKPLPKIRKLKKL